MAGKSASILVKIIGDESGFKKSLGGAGSELDSFSKKMDAQGQRMQGLGAKMTAGVTLPIVAFGAVAVKNFMEAEKAQAQLEASLKSTGATAWTSADQMDELASSMQDKYAVDGDLVKSGASLLLTFTKVKNAAGEGNDVFDRTTQTAIDMSRKLGMDLPAANMLLGKSLNDPIKGMGALRKAGVQLTAQQEAQVRAFVASGDILSAQKVILGELETQFAGSAAAYAETTEGQLEAAKLALEDVSEEIGARLVPVLTSMGDGLVTALEKWDGLSEGTQTFVLILAGVAAALGPVTTVVGTIMRAGTALSDMRGKLTQVTTTADGSTTSLTRVGKAAAGLGAAGAAFAVYQMAQALNEATKDAVGLETAMNDLKAADGPKDVGKAIQDAAAASEGWGDKLSDLGDSLGGGMWDEGSVSVDGYRVELDNVSDVLKAIKETGDDDLMRGAIAAFREADTSGARGIGTVDRFNATLDSYAENLDSAGAAAAKTAEEESAMAGGAGDVAAGVEEVASELVAAAPGFDTFIAKLSSTAGFADALTAALAEVFGPKMDLEAAAAGWESALDSLSAAIAENGTTLDIATDKGRANREMLVSSTEASLALLEAEVAGGMGAEEAAGRHKMRTENLIKEAIQSGFTEQQVRDLIGTYGDVPPDVITRAQFQAIQAKIDAKDLTGAALIYDAMSPSARATFEKSAASADVQAIQAELDRLDGRNVSASVSLRLDDAAYDRLVSIRAGFRALGGPVRKGQPYVVGEEGPELVVPDANGTVMTAAETSSILAGGAGGRALVGASSSPSVVVHLEGAVIAGRDAERWLVETIETAVARGIQMPKLKTALR
jgi:hypothetical protein